MYAENPDEKAAMPMYIFLTNEITSEQLEMLGVYAQQHTMADFVGHIEVARDTRALLQSAP